MATPCKIRIIRPLNGVYPLYQPTVGKVYDATFYPEQRCGPAKKCVMCHECVAIDIAGKKIVVRPGEYEMVGDGAKGEKHGTA